MKYFPKVSRGNVYLSPVNTEDYEIYAKRSNDSRITDGIHGTPRMISLFTEKQYLENIINNKDYQFAIVRKEDDKLLGMIGLYHLNHINQTAELGIMIGEVDEHNKGYGSDAINALLMFSFNTLNLYNICLRVKPFNKGAIACYKKCGFKEMGKLHHCEYCNGDWYDIILMEMLKPDWQKKNK